MFVYNPSDMRKFILIVLTFLAAGVIFLSFGELESIVRTLRHGNFWFLLLAILIQSGWFLVSGSTYLSLYRLLHMDGILSKITLLFEDDVFACLRMSPCFELVGVEGMDSSRDQRLLNGSRQIGWEWIRL